MPKPKALKVFRTPIGFHDAYVATSTKKAALEAWGSHRNLFALGEAEQVTDAKLTRAPLATPGVVIKVSRGTTAEQLKALPPNEQPESKRSESSRASRPDRPAPKAAVPRPSRAKLEKAEAALAKLSAAHAKELAAIDEQIDALRDRRAALGERQSKVVQCSVQITPRLHVSIASAHGLASCPQRKPAKLAGSDADLNLRRASAARWCEKAPTQAARSLSLSGSGSSRHCSHSLIMLSRCPHASA